MKHDQLSYYNDQTHTFDVEEGMVDLMVGASSADIRLHTTITTEGAVVKGTYLSSQTSNINRQLSTVNSLTTNVYDLQGHCVGTLDDYDQLPRGLLLLTGNHKFIKKVIQ